MTRPTKYVVHESDGGRPTFATHHLLRRDVLIHRVACSDISPDQHAHLRDVLSRMGRLDHPHIPYLLDVEREDATCRLLVERPASPAPDAAEDVIGWVTLWTQLAQTLAYASTLGLAHGQCEVHHLQADDLGELRLLGVGWLQCETQTPLAELQRRDLLATAQLALASLQGASSNSPPEHDLQLQMQALFQTIRNEAAHWDMANVAAKLTAHLAKAEQARDHNRLKVETAASPERTHRSGRRYLPAIFVAGAMLLVVGGFLAWPRPTTKPPQSPVQPAADSRAPAPRDPGPSALANVGTINQASSPTPRGPSPDDEAPPRPEDDPAPERSEPPADAVSAPRSPSETPPETPVNQEAPFASFPEHSHLPDPEQFSWTTLGEWTEPPVDALSLQLLGGSGAHREATFSLRPSSGGWLIESTSAQRTAQLATLRAASEGLVFRWSPRARSLPSAAFLRNTAIALQSGAFTTTLLLRIPERLPALGCQFQGPRNVDLPLRHWPSLDSVFLRITPQRGQSVEPTHTIPAADGTLRVQLPPKLAPIVLQIEAPLEERKKLRLTPMARASSQAPLVAVPRGALLQAQREYQQLARARKAWQSNRNRMRDGATKDALDRQIKNAQSQLTKLSTWIRRCQAAQKTSVELLIYRQVDDLEIPLVVFARQTSQP